MKINLCAVCFMAMLFMVSSGVVSRVNADDHGEKKSHHHQYRDHDDDDEREHGSHARREETHHHREKTMAAVDNDVYKETCGACHFAYPPALLPSGSWKKILDAPSDHFGEGVELDDQAKQVIAAYLSQNGAERSRTEQANHIIRSLAGKTPKRITDIPYIQLKHQGIPPVMIKESSVKSLSNCNACHLTAEKGVFDDDEVTIPR